MAREVRWVSLTLILPRDSHSF
ncbi:unnamed protein product [Acanthoscelides obtectus]|uniref:Uncharacterized protein n=1 Tax=Acanthoscelides obtectus TaxID=200917 RepID=A0A9P0MJ01_ACAOB|nr:unnamed protein product [Acanthoscelides obtectus]CAK1682913.1 hypothetical protein AOBTE_LOCUS33984 [Acanthoscelides obtectus]